jgi:hypothetical protein
MILKLYVHVLVFFLSFIVLDKNPFPQNRTKIQPLKQVPFNKIIWQKSHKHNALVQLIADLTQKENKRMDENTKLRDC